jgi:hypothetical protein
VRDEGLVVGGETTSCASAEKNNKNKKHVRKYRILYYNYARIYRVEWCAY